MSNSGIEAEGIKLQVKIIISVISTELIVQKSEELFYNCLDKSNILINKLKKQLISDYKVFRNIKIDYKD